MLQSNNVQKLKERYAHGTRVKLISMDDTQAPPKGTMGSIIHVDDIGTIHVAWDNGSSLGLIPDVDTFTVI